MTPHPTAFTRTIIIAAAALIFLMIFSAISLPMAQAGEECVSGQVYTVPTHYESDDAIDWGPTLVIWGCIIVFAVGVILAVYLRLMAWIRKFG